MPRIAETPPTLRQVAALPLRKRDGVIEVCLITTRETRRWTLPKGWPMKGRKSRDVARIEAEQEAGLIGKPKKTPAGSFLYWKRRESRFDLVSVAVYLLPVAATLPTWKEQAERQVAWFSLADAALMVDEPSLATLLANLRV
ncbi:NUDIX hydrolase [Siculibacillus lacustris]|uniref:NUDIX hydrolase n=1 Tax=Siculibacillus lacustris TaxID=1549641 RepID=A0A4Q9VI27_9HYPH|nr:NUDIX hydrolase [Siculibacillus lacustris]TBW34848.1 NUDIX hydrolase [Siculibacillus lacustris]